MPTTQDRSKPRVLIAEDVGLIALDVAHVIRTAGCRVIGPHSSLATLLAAVEAEHVDAAFLDVDLGGTDVFPAVDRLVARGTPVVLLTGYSTTQLPARYRALPLLEKPVSPESITIALSEALA